MSKPDIIVVGHHGVGQIIRVPHFPKPGETVESLGEKKLKDSGKGPNQAICMSLLGCSAVFIGKVGDDQLGHLGEQWMQEAGVDTSGMIFSDSYSTGRGIIFLDNQGQNTIINGYKPEGYLTFDELKPMIEKFADAKYFVTGFEIPYKVALECTAFAKELGMTTIINPGPATGDTLGDLSYVDYLIPNETESLLMVGYASMADTTISELASALREKTHSKTVIITLGSGGCVGLDEDGYWEIPGIHVGVVDTTGAGDAFIGALTCALSKGSAVREATKWANYVAALSVTKEGSFPSYASREEVEEFIFSIQKQE
ncbi:MAG: ribokinase [Anaerolineaceae bacterium]|nr:ribokinase [Anaerolineaceae bacterium]